MSLLQMANNGVQYATMHHTANVAAVAVPFGAIAYHLPDAIVATTGLLGAVWYLILIGEKVALWRVQWRQTRESANRVALKLGQERQDKRNGNETTSD
jgi:hypothetical protein